MLHDDASIIFIDADSDSTASSIDILIQFGNIWNQQKSAGVFTYLLRKILYYYD